MYAVELIRGVAWQPFASSQGAFFFLIPHNARGILQCARTCVWGLIANYSTPVPFFSSVPPLLKARGVCWVPQFYDAPACQCFPFLPAVR